MKTTLHFLTIFQHLSFSAIILVSGRPSQLLLILILMTGQQSFAQTNVYHPFPDSNATWQIMCKHYNGIPPAPPSVSSTKYTVTGADTAIGAFTYKKIVDGAFYIGAYRQDIPNKKIYCIMPGLNQFWIPPNTDHLFYDFSLAIGDTFSSRPLAACDSNSIVTSIDSISVGGTYRKKINLTSTTGFPISIIEGIGSEAGLFEQSCFETYCELCTYKDDSVIFNGSCFVRINETANQKFKIDIFPNPSPGIFSIKSDEEFQFSIHDIFGGKVFQSANQPINPSATLDLSSHAKGIYFVKVQSGTGIISRKIILQ